MKIKIETTLEFTDDELDMLKEYFGLEETATRKEVAAAIRVHCASGCDHFLREFLERTRRMVSAMERNDD